MNVLVLLSTYNGENYIGSQIESIINQKFSGDIHFLIRDDGSTDKTVEIVRSFDNQKIELVRGENLGVKCSYKILLNMARDRRSDFYALADQDDIWLPNKLQKSADILKNYQSEALYCSALILVDKNLKKIGYFYHKGNCSFPKALYRNYASGCSLAFNYKLLKTLSRDFNIENILMHDWWIYLVASVFGKVYYDKDPQILYRQHEKNVIGLGLGLDSIHRRIDGYFKRASFPSRVSQAKEFLSVYNDKIPDSLKYDLEAFAKGHKNPVQRFLYLAKFGFKSVDSFQDSISLSSFMTGR